jgi:phage major head subunit gpT-like protein
MEVSAANLTAIFTTFDTKFTEAFEAAPTYYDNICTVTRSASRETFYPWMGRTSQFREWVGERRLQAIEAKGYTLVNRKFENSITISRDDIEDDVYGIYAPIIQDLGVKAAAFPNLLVFGMMKAAVTGAPVVKAGITIPVPTGYDGLNFFAPNHPAGPLNESANDVTFANINSSGSGPYWFLIDAGRPLRPFLYQIRRPMTISRMNTLTDEMVWSRDEFRYGVDCRANAGVAFWQLAYASNTDLSNPANFGAAIAAMRSITGDDGLPFGSWDSPSSDRYLVVPPALEEVARQLLHGDFGAINVAGAVGGIPGTNIYRGECQLIVTQYVA